MTERFKHDKLKVNKLASFAISTSNRDICIDQSKIDTVNARKEKSLAMSVETKQTVETAEEGLNTAEAELMQLLQHSSEKEEASSATTMKDIPEVIDLKVVVKMFTELKTKIGSLEKKMESQQKITEQVKQCTSAQQSVNNEIADLKMQVDEYKTRTNVLTGALGRVTQISQELQSRMDRVEAANAKRMMVISGFYASKKKHIRRSQLLTFLSEEMCVDAEIEDSYITGDNNPPNIVVTLGSVENKANIYENIYRIKDIVNSEGKGIFFRDFVPSSTQEYKRRQQEVIKEARQNNPNVEVSYNRDGLVIKNKVYTKKVQVPDPTEILLMEEDTLEEILSMKLSKAPRSILKDNTFVAYSICAQDYETVQKAYMNVKLSNAGARHIVCAWNIDNEMENEYERMDYQDDDEYGAGREILKVLVDNNIKNRAVFVARYYSGKIGAERFNEYRKVTNAVIKQSPYNHIIGQDQNVQEENADMRSPPNKKQYQPKPGRSGKGHGSNQRGRGGKYNSDRGQQEKRLYVPRSEDLIVQQKERRKQANTGMQYHFSDPQTLQKSPSYAAAVKNAENMEIAQT